MRSRRAHACPSGAEGRATCWPQKTPASSYTSEPNRIPAKAGKREGTEGPQTGNPDPQPRAGPRPASRPPRGRTGNPTARGPPLAGDRSGASLPGAAPPSPHPQSALLFPSQVAAAPRHRRRSVQAARALDVQGGLVRPAASPQAPARPPSRHGSSPRQRGLRGPLLRILSRRHRPSVAETGTSSAASTKAPRRRLERSACRDME